MTNEIKEILDDLDYCKSIKSGNILLKSNECDDLLDYITNLQEENERYKKIFEGKERFSKIMPDDTDFIILSKADYDRQQEDIELTAIKMKQRIDKAIKKIEKDAELIDLEDGYNTCMAVIDILRGDE